MTGRPPRVLVSTERAVPPEDEARYTAIWRELTRAVEAGAGHAWRFHAAADPRRFLEFLEFRADADPRRREECAARLEELGALWPGRDDEWVEA